MKTEWMQWPESTALAGVFKKDELRFVGGCVRNALLDIPVTDVDAATPLLPDKVMQLLQAAGIKAVPTGIEHGTVTAVIGKKHFEITTLRKDTSCDGRHAVVEFTRDWKEDASRRDFTMNAIYLSPEGEMFDYFGGEADAKAGRVKFIGKPEDRIKEDYLRILRFFRFYAWYGKGEPDFNALSACVASAEGLKSLSGERIAQEMFKLLSAPAPYETLGLMRGHEILSRLLGGAVNSLEPIARLQRVETMMGRQADVHVRLALLVPGQKMLEHVISAWKLSNESKDHLHMLLVLSGRLHIGASVSEQKKLLRHLRAPRFKELAVLHWALDGDVDASRKQFEAMLKLADTWVIPEFPVTGKDLQAQGMAEGKALGDCLQSLEVTWEESDYRLTKKELLAKK